MNNASTIFKREKAHYSGGGDNLSTFMGTMFESLASESTLTGWQPDITPQDEEEAFALAATLGHTAGAIGGTLINYGLLKGAGAIALGAFRWGRAALGAAKVTEAMRAAEGAAQGAGQVFKIGADMIAPTSVAGATVRGMKGILEPASIFAVQEAAREYVKQTRENDPDAYALGQKAIMGFMQGGIWGWVGKATELSAPLTQAIGGGLSMAAAEAMQLATEGEEITPQDMGKAVLMGAGLSLIGARGWREKRDSAVEMAATIRKFTDNIVSEHTAAMALQTVAKGYVPPKDIEALGKLVKELTSADLRKMFKMSDRQLEIAGLPAKDKFKGVVRSAKDIFEIPEEKYRAMIGEATGGRTTSTKDLTVGETREAFSRVREYGEKNIGSILDEANFAKAEKWMEKYQPTIHRTGKTNSPITPGELTRLNELKKEFESLVKEETGIKFADKKTLRKDVPDILDEMTEYGERELKSKIGKNITGDPISIKDPHLMTIFRPLTPIMEKMGAFDLIAPLAKAKRTMDVLNSQARAYIEARFTQFSAEMKQPIVLASGETINNKQLLFRAMDTDNPQLLAELTAKMTDKQRAITEEFREYTKFWYDRENEALVAMGLPKFKNREHYITHIVKRPKAQMAEDNRYGIRNVPELDINRRQTTRGAKEAADNPYHKTRTDNNLPYLEDPVLAMETMARYSLKTVFLQEPSKVLKAKVQAMLNSGQINDVQFNKLADIIEYQMLGIPTPATREMNAKMARWLTEGKVGKVATWLMDKFDKEIGPNPITDFAPKYGQAMQNAYMAWRPMQLFRNSMQSTFVMGFTGLKNFAKAMGPMSEQAKRLAGKSSIYQTQMSPGAFELDVVQGGKLQSAGNLPMTIPHNLSTQIAWNGAYHQFIEHLNHKNPKFNWGTAEGNERRLKMKKEGRKDWREFVTPEEETLMMRHMEEMTVNCEFLYHATGNPEIYANPAAKILMKFQSYPMNYLFQYLPAMWKNFRTGSPTWDTSGRFKYTPMEQLGIFRHFLLTGSILAGIDIATGANFMDAIGVAYSPTLNKQDKGLLGTGIVPGTFEMRPSMSVAAVQSMYGMFLETDPYLRKKAQKNFLSTVPLMLTGAVGPGGLAVKEIKRSIDEGDAGKFFFRKFPEQKRGSKAAQVFGGLPQLPSLK